MKRKITALVSIIIILLSNSANLFASDHSDCKIMEAQNDNHCEMMEMKMDCCPSEQPLSQACVCPEMNNSDQTDSELPQYTITKSLENPGKILVQFITLNHYVQIISNQLHVNSYNSLSPDNKIYKSIQSFLI